MLLGVPASPSTSESPSDEEMELAPTPSSSHTGESGSVAGGGVAGGEGPDVAGGGGEGPGVEGLAGGGPGGEGDDGDEESADETGEDGSKKQKQCFKIPDEEEDQVIEWVREHQCLWNRKRSDYRNTVKKEALWAEKGAELGLTKEHIMGWYKGLRDSHTRLLKRQKSGAGALHLTDREEWIRQKFMFLRDVGRQTRAPVTSVSTHEFLEHFVELCMIMSIFNFFPFPLFIILADIDMVLNVLCSCVLAGQGGSGSVQGRPHGGRAYLC